MKIIYNDGSILSCSSVVFNGGDLEVDDLYSVPIGDIERIEDDDEEEV